MTTATATKGLVLKANATFVDVFAFALALDASHTLTRDQYQAALGNITVRLSELGLEWDHLWAAMEMCREEISK